MAIIAINLVKTEPVNNFYIGGTVYSFVTIDNYLFAEHSDGIRYGNFFQKKEFETELTGYEESYSMFRIPNQRKFLMFSNRGKITEFEVTSGNSLRFNYDKMIIPGDRYFSTFWSEKIKGRDEVILTGYYSSFIVRYNYLNSELGYFDSGSPVSELSASSKSALLINTEGSGLKKFDLQSNTVTQDLSYLAAKGDTPISVANYGIYDECETFLVRTNNPEVFAVDLNDQVPLKVKTFNIANEYTYSIDYIPGTHFFVTNSRATLWVFSYISNDKFEINLPAEVFRFNFVTTSSGLYFGSGDRDGRIQIRELTSPVCHFSCATCSGGALANQCDTCKQGYIKDDARGVCESQCVADPSLPIWDQTTSQCVNECPDKTYRVTDKLCLACNNINCAECDKSGECKICDTGFIAKEGNCIAENAGNNNQCGDGYFLNSLNTCQSCHKSCQRCDGHLKSNCLECHSNSDQFIMDSTCQENCPDTQDFFNSEARQCHFCDSNCLTCFSKYSFHCSSCNEGTYYIAGQCVDLCPPGYVNSDSDQTCRVCEGEDCPPCLDDRVVFEGKCTSECPDGYFNYQTVCVECPIRCERCLTQNLCVACVSGYSLSRTGSCIEKLSVRLTYLIFLAVFLLWIICVLIYCKVAKKNGRRRRRRNPNERDAIAHALPVEAFDRNGDILPQIVQVNFQDQQSQVQEPEEADSQYERDKILREKSKKMSFVFKPVSSKGKGENVDISVFKAIIKGEEQEELIGDGKVRPYKIPEGLVKEQKMPDVVENRLLKGIKAKKARNIKQNLGDQDDFVDFGKKYNEVEVKSKDQENDDKDGDKEDKDGK